ASYRCPSSSWSRWTSCRRSSAASAASDLQAVRVDHEGVDRSVQTRARAENGAASGASVGVSEPRIRVSAILRWRGSMLLCRHEKEGQREHWLLPGGGVNSGESLVDALYRELAEELGIDREPSVDGPVAIVDSISPV